MHGFILAFHFFWVKYDHSLVIFSGILLLSSSAHTFEVLLCYFGEVSLSSMFMLLVFLHLPLCICGATYWFSPLMAFTFETGIYDLMGCLLLHWIVMGINVTWYDAGSQLVSVVSLSSTFSLCIHLVIESVVYSRFWLYEYCCCKYYVGISLMECVHVIWVSLSWMSLDATGCILWV